jgi:hypothetical protein
MDKYQVTQILMARASLSVVPFMVLRMPSQLDTRNMRTTVASLLL